MSNGPTLNPILYIYIFIYIMKYKYNTDIMKYIHIYIYYERTGYTGKLMIEGIMIFSLYDTAYLVDEGFLL